MSRWYLALMIITSAMLYDPEANGRVISFIGGLFR